MFKTLNLSTFEDVLEQFKHKMSHNYVNPAFVSCDTKLVYEYFQYRPILL